jgi:hypothetical protein
MPQHYVLDKWIEYLKTLRDDLPIESLNEARDGFYAGVIAALSILEKTRGAALDDIGDESREYIQTLQDRLDKLKRTN